MKRWAIILTALALTGCIHYQPRPLDAAKRADDFEARRLDGDGLRAFIALNLGHEVSPWPPGVWNVESLTLAAYYFQPSLDVVRAQWRVAEATAINAGARPNPTVSFAPGFTANSPAGVSPWLMAVGFDWPVETAGKRNLRVTQAQHLVRVARLNLVTTAWQVRAKVRDHLAARSFAGAQAANLAEKVELQKELVTRLEARLKAGAIAQTEVTPARLALGMAEAERALARANEAGATARLAEAIGIPLRALAKVTTELTLQPRYVSEAQLAEARQRAVLNRSDLLAALAEYDASETALRLEIARQYPDLHFNPNYEYDQGANKWRLGVSLDLPVLNRNQGPIAEAKARRDETAARFTALRAKVISEIDGAAQTFQQAWRRHLDLIPGANAERNHVVAVETQVVYGAADTLDLLAVRLGRLNGAALLDEAGYRAAVAFGELEDATQQPLERRAGIVAPPPPEQLELNPRGEKDQP